MPSQHEAIRTVSIAEEASEGAYPRRATPPRSVAAITPKMTRERDALTEECRAEVTLPWRAPGLRAREGSVRFFVSDVAERLTSSSPRTPYALVLPVAVVCLVASVRASAAGEETLASVAGAIALGALLWTLVEYLMHRFLFHFPATGDAGRVVTFLVHGHHHVHPKDARRLVATPLQLTSLLLLFFGLFSLLLSPVLAQAAFAGFALAYLGYEAVHFAAHHGHAKTRVGRALARHHLRHHHETPHARFGISSPLWDAVFRTLR